MLLLPLLFDVAASRTRATVYPLESKKDEGYQVEFTLRGDQHGSKSLAAALPARWLLRIESPLAHAKRRRNRSHYKTPRSAKLIIKTRTSNRFVPFVNSRHDPAGSAFCTRHLRSCSAFTTELSQCRKPELYLSSIQQLGKPQQFYAIRNYCLSVSL